MRTAHRVVNVAGHGFGQAPFVPDVSTVDAAPEMNLDNIALKKKKEKRYMTSFRLATYKIEHIPFSS